MAKNQYSTPSGSDVAGSPIFKRFLGKAEEYIRKPTRLKKLLTDAYDKASQKNDVGTIANEVWDTLQTLFRLIKASASGEYTGVPGTTMAAAVAVLIYFISPIDLIPDFLPIVGLLDDAALVVWFSSTLKGEIDKFHEWETTRPTLVQEPEHHKARAESMAQRMNPDNRTAAAPRNTDPTADVEADELQPSYESAKNAGTTDLPRSPNTDAGLGSPDSSSPRPVHEDGPDAEPSAGPRPGADAPFRTTGSREGSGSAPLATGGNVR